MFSLFFLAKAHSLMDANNAELMPIASTINTWRSNKLSNEEALNSLHPRMKQLAGLFSPSSKLRPGVVDWLPNDRTSVTRVE